MTQPQNSLAKLTPQQLSQLPQTGFVTIDGKRYQVQLIAQQRIDNRPSHYQTALSRGQAPQVIKSPKLPNVLTMTLAAVVALSLPLLLLSAAGASEQQRSPAGLNAFPFGWLLRPSRS